MNYRDKTDISATILELVNGGASKSKIISTAFLNHSSSLQYFRMLLKNKLLVYQDNVSDHSCWYPIFATISSNE
jgi:predicted transcriptional regulator